jgi:hypothetical protein
MPSLNICISEKCGFILEENMCVCVVQRVRMGERRGERRGLEREKRAIIKGKEGCKE